MENEVTDEIQLEDENKIIATRKKKLKELRFSGQAFPNDFVRENLAADVLAAHADKEAEALKSDNIRVIVAGRIIFRRIMGKASFVKIQDMSGQIQLYLKRDALPEGLYHDFKKWDRGDIIGAEGTLFKTQTGELSVAVDKLRLLTKSLRPLPEKFHGLSDTEKRYRQRYLDLIVTEKSRQTFILRSKIIMVIRQFLRDEGYFEVETPMMHPIPGGAIARPFTTHHNALDMLLYLRIAPELYLKRLVVAGFEKVFEINRNFRNEGVSTQHNPEFTMLEFYQAYATYRDLMILTEKMIRHICHEVLGETTVHYQGQSFDFAKPFKEITLKNSICEFNPDISLEQLEDFEQANALALKLGIKVLPTYGLGKVQLEIFEKTVEERLIEPTFITEYPAEVSPLARANDDNPFITDRFEFFIAGREIANGFSEINDPEDQAERFNKQVEEKEAGDEEAMYFDDDYITALEFGMPPTAGEGIGIDRLVMLLTDNPSIRDVLLFPHMRPLTNL